MRPDDSGYTVDGQGDPGGDYIHRLYPPEALIPMVKECDFLVICVPLTSLTRDLINANVLGAMKETAFIIDISRGGILNHSDLLAAVREHKLAGAALDVFPEEPLPQESPLWKLPNVLISSHISGNTPFYDVRAAELFSINLKRFLDGEKLLNLVDFSAGY
jgi:phosphoglycerate dehydrogenase-like enzyme